MERILSVNSDRGISDENQEGNQTLTTNREISEKKQLFIGNVQNDTNEKDLLELLGLRSTQYLKQNCLSYMLFINKTRKRICVYSYARKGSSGTIETEWNRFAWWKDFDK